jgi:short subunit fatty acids transporter
VTKKKIQWIITIMVLLVLALTNPSEQDYKKFDEEKYGKPPITSFPITLDRKNFFFFSTYTPVFVVENGNTHLGIMGHFIQISNGGIGKP